MKGVQGSEEAYKEAEALFGQRLDAYEKILAKQKFMGGDVSVGTSEGFYSL